MNWICLFATIISLITCTAQAALSGGQAKALFERIKASEGDFLGHSTKGWTETSHVQVIAGGSAVLVTSFDAHPAEHMVTMIHLDGDRLLLTHYCMAKNQPRLVATAYDEANGDATFEFLDGTGMKSRDTGHMDKVVMHFADSDHWSERWTWYANGSEKWLEDIQFKRTK